MCLWACRPLHPGAALWASLQCVSFTGRLGGGARAEEFVLPFAVEMFTFVVFCVHIFHFNYWSMLQPGVWSNLCWNADLLMEVSRKCLCLSWSRPWPLSPGWEESLEAAGGPGLTARAGGPWTSASSVLRGTLRGWDFWLLLFDFYFLMRLFEVNSWIKFRVLCVGQN